jgi:hypothetical protein
MSEEGITPEEKELRYFHDEEYEQERENKSRLNAEHENFVNALTYVMADKRGRNFVRWLLGLTRSREISFNSDAAKMAFLEGHRNVGNQLFEVLEREVPELYLQLINEETNDRHNDKQ